MKEHKESIEGLFGTLKKGPLKDVFETLVGGKPKKEAEIVRPEPSEYSLS